jgi:hypothetical protein
MAVIEWVDLPEAEEMLSEPVAAAAEEAPAEEKSGKSE